jgi:hypothetical protein
MDAICIYSSQSEDSFLIGTLLIRERVRVEIDSLILRLLLLIVVSGNLIVHAECEDRVVKQLQLWTDLRSGGK